MSGEIAKIKDWLQLHELDCGTVADCLSALTSGRFDCDLADFSTLDSPPFESFLQLEDALDSIVRPALCTMLASVQIAPLMKMIRWTTTATADAVGDPAHTVNHGTEQPPEVCMVWGGTIADLICFVHETAHALQIQLSAGAFMPPIARETCAFLGELALIDWARQNEPALAVALVQVWRIENRRYLSQDCEVLSAAIADSETPYHYRLNYPLARAAAFAVFRRGDKDRIVDLFRSGAKAMALLPLDQIADFAGRVENYLPALPPPDAESPAINAYRSLGAMALLDIDGWKGESQRTIADYYAAMLAHLQKGTAFIGVHQDGKPLGYATWDVGDDGKIVLRRQCAPFGDHLSLQRALQHRLSSADPVNALHERSSRPEQRAW